MQQADKFIAIGASVLSDIQTPFTETVAKKMGKEYIQFADTGISNETIFRYISYVNLKYTNAIIMPVFTYLVREELVDIADIAHIAMPTILVDKNKRKKQIETFYQSIWNEKQATARFWTRLYDAKLSSAYSNNVLISVWDSSSYYDDEINIELNKEKLSDLHTNLFRNACIDENAFREVYLETLERSSSLDYHMTQQSHDEVANMLLKGTKHD